MAAAIDAVRNKQMSQRAACKAFEVPRCTLQMRLLGKTELRAKPGRPSALSAEQEEKLVDYTRNQASMGIGFGRFFVWMCALHDRELHGDGDHGIPAVTAVNPR